MSNPEKQQPLDQTPSGTSDGDGDKQLPGGGQASQCIPKIHIRFPPNVFAEAASKRNQQTIVKHADVPLQFKRAKGKSTAMLIDVVGDVIGPSGTVTRRVIHQYVLTARGSDGQLTLRPLDAKVPQVPPAFVSDLLRFPLNKTNAETDDEDEDDDDWDDQEVESDLNGEDDEENDA